MLVEMLNQANNPYSQDECEENNDAIRHYDACQYQYHIICFWRLTKHAKGVEEVEFVFVAWGPVFCTDDILNDHISCCITKHGHTQLTTFSTKK